MRIAAITDIHGNLRALQAVLADMADRSPDIIVNLGDCVSGPLEPAETGDLLMERGFLTIRGNHDRQLLDRPVSEMGPIDRFTAAHLSERHRTWLAGLPPPAVVDLTYLLETVDAHGIRITPRARLDAQLASSPQSLILCGHSHNPRAVAASNGRLVVNPGSVGLQAYHDTVPYPHMMEVGSPHARYAIIDTGPRPRVEFMAVEYGWASASADARRAGHADWAHALAGGFVGPH